MGKNFIDIDPKKSQGRYIIYNELKEFGRAIIEDTSDKNEWWRGAAREIGQDANKIGKIAGKQAILPPASSLDHHIGYVLLNKGVIIREEKIGNKSRFILDVK